MSVNSEMTAIADKIRALLGLSGTMGLDAMATNLETEQTNIANAFTAVGNKGGTIPSSKVSGNLATAINSIPEGATIDKTDVKSVSTNTSGSVNVSCGFKPDAVFLKATSSYQNGVSFGGINFTELGVTSGSVMMTGSSSSYAFSNFTVTQQSSGFSVSAKRYNTSLSASNDSNRSFSYVAIKYK